MLKNAYYAFTSLTILFLTVSQAGASQLNKNIYNNQQDNVYYTRYENTLDGRHFIGEIWKDKKGNIFELEKYIPSSNSSPQLLPDVKILDKNPLNSKIQQVSLIGADLQVLDKKTGQLSFYKYDQQRSSSKAVCIENLEPGRKVAIYIPKNTSTILRPIVTSFEVMKDLRNYAIGSEAIKGRTTFDPKEIIATPGNQIFDPQFYPFLTKSLPAESLGCYQNNGKLELQKLSSAETTNLYNALNQKDKNFIENQKNNWRTPPNWKK